ncbi:MAG: NAD(P)H-dependent oxidoreductase subunit E, partial [Candidatus Methanoperedens sp.]|nr:NAD(P)H-dependent oxidoreductase subunit E [Candidatus Methanoperedens sp.]
MKISSVKQLDDYRRKIQAKRNPDKPCITVCGGPGCLAKQCIEVRDAFVSKISAKGLKDRVDIRTTGCHGYCERGPIALIFPQGIFYQKLTVEDVNEIVEDTIINSRTVDRLVYTDTETGETIEKERDVPFYKGQMQLILKDNRRIDPHSLEDYIALGGYSALAKVLGGMKPQQVLDEIKKSGLRGRGGGGFPTGVQWESTRNAPGDKQDVICNADEGDPGAYMDRSILEGNPHSVLEGMIIGAYTIGSHEGYVYVR